MAYSVFVECDQDGCNARHQVNQPGDLPEGWSYIEFIKTAITLELITNGRAPNQKVRVRKIFCGWRCHMKEIKKYLTEKVDA